jgi:RNA polymerase sigma factor (sigma-70 family)
VEVDIPISQNGATVVGTEPRADLRERFNRLLAAEGPALVRLAASYTNSQSDRDDLYQDIALAIWKALPRFRGESSERTFVFRIAHNRGIARITRRRPAEAGYEEGEQADSGPGPEAVLSKDQQQQRLLWAIQRLPISYRQVVTLTLEDMSYAEIAEVLGISESNVGARLSRARLYLRRLLEAEKNDSR